MQMKYIRIFWLPIPIRLIHLTGFSSQILGFLVKRCWQHWCMCVCVCTYMYVCMCACMFVHGHVHDGYEGGREKVGKLGHFPSLG